MALLSVTRVRLHKARFAVPFVRFAIASANQAKQSGGFIGGYLANGWPLTFWTVTVWQDREAMQAYRGSGTHREAMPSLAGWCSEASLASIDREDESVPEPAEAGAVLREYGRTGRVLHPSAAHSAGETWPDSKPGVPGMRLRP